MDPGADRLRPHLHDPRYNWMYEAQPDPALDNRRAFWPRGKVLGGSSSINAMVYVRGQPADFDDWCAAGNPGWSWAEVLPYFKQARGPPLGRLRVPRRRRPGAVSATCRRACIPCAARSSRPAARSAFPYTPISTARSPRARACGRSRSGTVCASPPPARICGPALQAARTSSVQRARAGDARAVQRHARERRRVSAAAVRGSGAARAAR